jgi:transposase, IS30 family
MKPFTNTSILNDQTSLATWRHKKRHSKGHSRKHRRSHIPNRVSLDQRSEAAHKRQEPGHWEGDSVLSSRSLAALNVLVERSTRVVVVTKLKQKTAQLSRQAITKRLQAYPQQWRKTITYDNGSENVQHEIVNKRLGTKSYFCAPYHSWEKGTVENTIGLIRRFLPKRTDFSKVTPSQLTKIEHLLNNRPRKCLDFQTPREVANSLGVALPG